MDARAWPCMSARPPQKRRTPLFRAGPRPTAPLGPCYAAQPDAARWAPARLSARLAPAPRAPARYRLRFAQAAPRDGPSTRTSNRATSIPIAVALTGRRLACTAGTPLRPSPAWGKKNKKKYPRAPLPAPYLPPHHIYHYNTYHMLRSAQFLEVILT